MRRLILNFALVCVTSFSASVSADDGLVVVTNQQNPVSSMTKSQVIDLFMGKYVAYPDGRRAIPIDNDGRTDQKQLFYEKLVDLSLARVNSYWSRIRFTGRASPPLAEKDADAIVSFIEMNQSAIGYIPRTKLTDQLKVVYEFDE